MRRKEKKRDLFTNIKEKSANGRGILGFESIRRTGEDVEEGGRRPKGCTPSESEMEGRWKRMRSEREVSIGVGRYGRRTERMQKAEEEWGRKGFDKRGRGGVKRKGGRRG